MLALSAGFIAWQGHRQPVFAADDEEEGDDGDDGGSGKDEVSDEDAEEDKEQPPVTAGGLFTLATYPVNELLRPLTMTEKIAQVRVSTGTDVSDKGAFKTFGVSLEALYGVKDNFTLLGGFTDAYNFKQFGVYFGFEGSLMYDLVDIRLAANVHRSAIPKPCTADIAGCTDAMGMVSTGPSGEYDAGKTQFSLDIGFPFRYALKPEIAIVALQTLMSVDFNQVKQGDVVINKTTPDLLPSIGIATNPIPQLSLVAQAQLRLVDFDTSTKFTVPVTGRVEFSPSQKLDVGLEFTLLNVKPPEGTSPIANRFVSLFLQARFGK